MCCVAWHCKGSCSTLYPSRLAASVGTAQITWCHKLDKCETQQSFSLQVRHDSCTLIQNYRVHVSHLRLGGHITGEQQPQQRFWHRLTTLDVRRELRLAVGDRQPAETDALYIFFV